MERETDWQRLKVRLKVRQTDSETDRERNSVTVLLFVVKSRQTWCVCPLVVRAPRVCVCVFTLPIYGVTAACRRPIGREKDCFAWGLSSSAGFLSEHTHTYIHTHTHLDIHMYTHTTSKHMLLRPTHLVRQVYSVCVRERERECVCVWERECVCVCEREVRGEGARRGVCCEEVCVGRKATTHTII